MRMRPRQRARHSLSSLFLALPRSRPQGQGLICGAMRIRRFLPFLTVVSLLVVSCGGDEIESETNLEIDRRVGYAVIVDNRPDGLSIGFSTDRDAEAGEAYDVSQSVWRIEAGPWIEPPVTCLGKGQRVELGVAQVENEARPGLLNDRVVWIVCLPPEDS